MSISSILKNFLSIIIQASPKGYHVVLRGRQFHFIIEYLNTLYPQLDNARYNLGTKAYWLLHDIKDFPKCKNPNCNNVLSHKNAIITTGYGTGYCSVKCEMNDATHQMHLKKIFQQQYGVDYYTESDDFKQKCKCAWGQKTPDDKKLILERRQNTNLGKFGVKCVLCNECEVRRQIDEKQLEEHGTKTWCNPQKVSQTKRQRSHKDPEYYSKISKKRNDTIKRLREKDPLYQKRIYEKTRNTVERHRKEDPSYQEKINHKTMQTNLKNIGYAWPIQCPAIRSKMNRKYLYDGIMFDSAPEIAYYIWLTDNKIEFVYHPDAHIQYVGNDRKLHCYEPDFLIIQTNQLEDIKGKHFFKEGVSFKLSQEYLKCLEENNVRLILEDEYMIYVDYCAKKFNCKKWHLQFKFRKNLAE